VEAAGFSVEGFAAASAGFSPFVAGFAVSSASSVCPGGVGRSGGVTSPAGFFGSKNPAGFGIVATSSMFCAAEPASCRPALRPMRGSALPAGTADGDGFTGAPVLLAAASGTGAACGAGFAVASAGAVCA
jgi:hypothetical protein